MPNTPVPMTLVEQRNKLLAATKDEHYKFLRQCGFGLPGASGHENLLCPTCQLIAQIESQIAKDNEVEEMFENLSPEARAKLDSIPPPRVQIIRQAKRLIEALNLPEGAGVAWTPTMGWTVHMSEPRRKRPPAFMEPSFWYSDGWCHLVNTALEPWPIKEMVAITRNTPETEEV